MQIRIIYHDAFFTPGISPFDAISLKQILQRPKSRIYARPLPHLKHRFVARDGYFGSFCDLTTTDFLAMII